jgi:glycosyltransferase involved in cell wall biosynthesis
MSLSVCIIAHDEEGNLDRTLSSLGWADEIILVDCGSSDGTAEVARKYTDRIFTRPNLPNLNVNKNFSFEQAASEWILCLDADEVVTEALGREIRGRAAADPPEQGFFLKRRNSWFGRFLMHGGQYPDRQLRFFRRGRGRFPEGHVHERLEVQGAAGTLGEPLDHYPYATVSRYLRKMDFYTTFEAERLHREGRRFTTGGLLLEILAAKWRFFRRYILKAGFLDGWQGFAAASLDFFSRMVVQFKLKGMGSGVEP